MVSDSLTADPGNWSDIVMIIIVAKNGNGKVSEEIDIVIDREDFWTTTSTNR